MSTITPSTLTTDRERALPDRLTGVIETVRAPVRAASFWTAVLLPFTYLPLLVGGMAGGEASLFVALVAANALALVAGHNHGR
jgi:hypothetical protein